MQQKDLFNLYSFFYSKPSNLVQSLQSFICDFFLLIFYKIKERVLSLKACTIFKLIIISNSIRMQPFDQTIKKYTNSEPGNQNSFNFPINSNYSFNTMPWNIDYSSLINPSYYPPSNYFYLPNSQFSGLDEIKSANQATRPNQTLEINQVQKKEQQAQVQDEQEIKNQKPCSLKIQQKYGRNILSNIFHITLKKILSTQFSQIIFKAIQRNKMSINSQQFKQRLEEKTKDMKGYINMKFIKSLKVGKPIGATRQDIQFRKLLRILCRIYHHNYHIPHIFHTVKIKKESRVLHLKCLRKLSKKNKK